jgi:dihydrolipoamide dehydrogenase
VDFAQLMQHKQQIVNGLVQDTAQQFKRYGVTRIQGAARFADTHTVVVQGKKISSRYLVLATGSAPIALPFLPFDETRVVSSTGALSFDSVPKRLLVIGGGAIGLELASVYQRLGSKIAIVEMMPAIVPGMDQEISRAFLQLLKKQGIQFYLQAKVTGAELSQEQVKISVEQEGKSFVLEGDRLLVAIGRKPDTKELGLEQIGIPLARNGMVPIDANFRTACPHILAIGDIVEGPMLAHKATQEGEAAIGVLAGRINTIQYASIPNVVYTSPEVAAVGFTEQEAQQAKITPLIGKIYMRGNPRAHCSGSEEGFVKVIGDFHTGRLIGMHFLCAHASEMIAEGVVALNSKATLEQLAHSSHPHPTLSESIMEACAQAKVKNLSL